jgi:threonyl-tRNA synthetase
MKVPYTVVVGDKEIDSATVAVRDREGQEVHGVPFERFLGRLIEENSSRSLQASVAGLG